MARDADLDSLKPEMIMIIITPNSLDPKDRRLREKMLEAVGQGKEKMTDTVFLQLIGEHEAWLANNSDKTTFKAKKAGVNKHDDTQSTKPACWCCGEEGHYKDRCPKKEKAFCRKCRNKGHYEKACKSKSREASSRDSMHVRKARSTSKDKSRAASRRRSNSKGRGDRKKRDRLQTPASSYTFRARAVSTTKYSG